MTQTETKETISQRFRRNFFYGLIVILPIVATFWLVNTLIQVLSKPLNSFLSGTIEPFSQIDVPILASFLITACLITFIGFLARNIIGRAILSFFEGLMIRIPIISIVYKSIKQIITAFTFQNKGMLCAVLVEYPRKGIWALGFMTKEDASGLYDEDGNDVGEGKSTIFLPTTPNPTSGYYVYVDTKDIIKLSMSVENSIKVLMSAGVVSPEEIKKLTKTSKKTVKKPSDKKSKTSSK